jgi:hypothetical protein
LHILLFQAKENDDGEKKLKKQIVSEQDQKMKNFMHLQRKDYKMHKERLKAVSLMLTVERVMSVDRN